MCSIHMEIGYSNKRFRELKTHRSGNGNKIYLYIGNENEQHNERYAEVNSQCDEATRVRWVLDCDGLHYVTFGHVC